VPIVSIARALRGGDVGSVSTDDQLGAQLAVAHLHSLGHRRIAHIDGGRGAGATARRAGYIAAMQTLDLAVEEAVVGGEYTEGAGARAMTELLRRTRRATAVFAANDLSAVGAIGVIEGAGLAVPADISVVGFDDTALAALNHIGLTTVAQPSRAMGRSAAAMLVDHLEGGSQLRHVSMAPHLVLRQTTGESVPQ
jgi:DNA-binding LacI/PurR family transcriptional regulator